MLHRGRFLCVDGSVVFDLRACRRDVERRALVATLGNRLLDAQETDRAWYLLFVSFRDSSNDRPANRLGPQTLVDLGLLFLGGEKLHRSDFQIINHLEPAEVTRAAEALERVSRDSLRERYLNLNPTWFRPGDYLRSAEQLEFLLHWFGELRTFFSAHAGGGGHMLFISKYQ